MKLPRIQKCSWAGIAASLMAAANYMPPKWRWILDVGAVLAGGASVFVPRTKNERAGDYDTIPKE